VHSSVERNQLINYKIAADVNEVVGNNTETKQQQEPAQKLCSQVEKKKENTPEPKSIEFDYLHFAFGFANCIHF